MANSYADQVPKDECLPLGFLPTPACALEEGSFNLRPLYLQNFRGNGDETPIILGSK